MESGHGSLMTWTETNIDSYCKLVKDDAYTHANIHDDILHLVTFTFVVFALNSRCWYVKMCILALLDCNYCRDVEHAIHQAIDFLHVLKRYAANGHFKKGGDQC